MSGEVMEVAASHPGRMPRLGELAPALSAAVGGASWTAWAVLMALRPPGTPGRYRQADDLAPYLLVSMVMLSIAGAVLVFRHRHDVSRVVLWAVTAIGATAVALLGAASAMMAIDPDSAFMPVLVLGGFLALVVAMLTALWGFVRAGVTPRWMGLTVAVAVIVLLGANTEDWRAFLFVPFGLAWVVIGVAQFSAARTSRRLR
jgi:hypothetical protein